MTKQGCLIISLDFELFWGMLGVASKEAFTRQIDNNRAAVVKILELFEEYGIHATWATVGFLFFDSKAELLAASPSITPVYRTSQYATYEHLPMVGEDEACDRLHFAASLISKIRQTPDQEIATHTFSHFYCFDDTVGIEAFHSDLDAAIETARRHDVRLYSLVFPRNQCRIDYLQACHDRGILCYRGNPPSWVYRNAPGQSFNALRRAGRFVDCYWNLFGHQCYRLDEMRNLPLNLPASRFFRPASTTVLERLRLRRIKADLDHAAETGTCYHLWWHPHNFGHNLQTNLRSLETVLVHFRQLRSSGKLASLNMSEAALNFIGSPG